MCVKVVCVRERASMCVLCVRARECMCVCGVFGLYECVCVCGVVCVCVCIKAPVLTNQGLMLKLARRARVKLV